MANKERFDYLRNRLEQLKQELAHIRSELARDFWYSDED